MMNRMWIALTWLGLTLSLTAVIKAPPVATVKPDTLFIHGKKLVDNYIWLKDTDSRAVQSYLETEEKYAAKLLKPSLKIADEIYKEFISRLQETEITYPYLDHDFYYYSRTEKGKAYSIHCRKAGSLSSDEQIILDENKLAKGKAYFSLGTYVISPDQKLLAYSVDYNGNEEYSLYIKNLKTGKTTKTPFNNVSEVLWMADNQTLAISTMNARMQTNEVILWRLDAPVSKVLYLENDPAWDVSLYPNCDETIIFISTSSKDSNECYYLNASDWEGEIRCLLPRSEKHIYYPDYYDGKFYIRTNFNKRDYDIAVCDSAFTSKENWKILYRGVPGNPLENFLLTDKSLVVIQRVNGLKTLVIADRQSGEVTDRIVPAQPADINFWVNLNPLSNEFTYTTENEVTPLTVKSYNLNSKTTSILRQYLPAGNPDLSNYDTAQVSVTAADGAQIPLIITFRKYPDQPYPLFIKLSGYGAYGDCNDPYFSSTALSLLDRGIILATAHVRGGGEFGESWYDSGRLLNKKNSFTDFIACMDYLLRGGMTIPERLIIEGGSAGGLLMGAVTNMAPEKCGLVIADVPFVDLMQTMLDDSLPLTIQEYEEWGNPKESMYFDYMLSYSPVDNVKQQEYPPMLITAAKNDTRVNYSEAVRWAAKLRANNTGNNPIILNLHADEGHTGQANRYKALKSYAEEVAWMLYLLSQ